MLLQMAGFPCFSRLNNIPLGLYMCVCARAFTLLFISSSVDGQLGLSHVLTVVNNAAVSTWVQLPLQDNNFISFGCIPRSGIAELYLVLPLIFWESVFCFHSGYISLKSHAECTRCPFLPRARQHFYLSDENHVRWDLTMALVCISLITRGAEIFLCSCWPFVCLLWKMFSCSAHFKIGLSGFLSVFL